MAYEFFNMEVSMEWDISTLEELEDKIWRCTACGNCKTAYKFGPPPEFGEICPAGVEFGFDGMDGFQREDRFCPG